MSARYEKQKYEVDCVNESIIEAAILTFVG